MLVDNHYVHCGEEWVVEDCDSFHNDRCPVCEAEIQPYQSTEYTSDGTKEHYHGTLDGALEEAGDDMGEALNTLIDKIEGIRGIEIEHYAGLEIDEARKTLSQWKMVQTLRSTKENTE